MAQTTNYLETTFENYYDGTVGCWAPIDCVPDDAVFIRHSTDKNGNITSSYWKQGNYIIRKSNHWGTKIANCDWWIFSQTEHTKIPCWQWIKKHNGKFIIAKISLKKLRHDLNRQSIYGTY